MYEKASTLGRWQPSTDTLAHFGCFDDPLVSFTDKTK